jgi:hypothetical protein
MVLLIGSLSKFHFDLIIRQALFPNKYLPESKELDSGFFFIKAGSTQYSGSYSPSIFLQIYFRIPEKSRVIQAPFFGYLRRSVSAYLLYVIFDSNY